MVQNGNNYFVIYFIERYKFYKLKHKFTYVPVVLVKRLHKNFNQTNMLLLCQIYVIKNQVTSNIGNSQNHTKSCQDSPSSKKQKFYNSLKRSDFLISIVGSMQQTYLHTFSCSSSTRGLIPSPFCSQWIRYLAETSSTVSLVKSMEIHIETALTEKTIELLTWKQPAASFRNWMNQLCWKNFYVFFRLSKQT